jgi:transposase
MKLTKDERLDVGRRMYNKEISYRDAMELYGISETCAHKWMTDYKRSQGIPVMSHSISKPSIQLISPDMETYMSMSKDELINELIKSKANELRAKKGYEVKGVGANKEFIPLNNKNSK